jgi:hypothetical protein
MTRSMRTSSLILSAALSIPLAACGDAPVPVQTPARTSSAPAGHSADDGHDHSAAAPVAQTGKSPSYSGVVVLKGAAADADGAFLMVSLRTPGNVMPHLSYKLPLANAAPAVDGVRRVPFDLNERTDMIHAGLRPELEGMPLELSVRFDQDGIVDTKVEGDTSAAIPVGWGGSGLEVVIGG